jgi:hypothetical protein
MHVFIFATQAAVATMAEAAIAPRVGTDLEAALVGRNPEMGDFLPALVNSTPPLGISQRSRRNQERLW